MLSFLSNCWKRPERNSGFDGIRAHFSFPVCTCATAYLHSLLRMKKVIIGTIIYNNFWAKWSFFFQSDCFLTRNWLDQTTTTNRIILSQALIIIRSKRNTFIIRNQNKRKSSLNLVAKFKNFNMNLLLWQVVTTVSLYRLADSPGKWI